MADELIDKKITQGTADRMMAPMELDLWALFKIMEEDMIKMVEGYEGVPEQFINEIVSMLSHSDRIEKERGDMPYRKETVKKNLMIEMRKLKGKISTRK